MSKSNPKTTPDASAKNDATEAASSADAVASQPETSTQLSEPRQTDSTASPLSDVAEDAPQSPDKPAKTIEQLEQQLAEANATIAELKVKQVEADAFDLAVREKMAAGLSKEQATAVLHRQREWDNSPLGKMQNARHARRQPGN